VWKDLGMDQRFRKEEARPRDGFEKTGSRDRSGFKSEMGPTYRKK
jgi:hypothetical protein